MDMNERFKQQKKFVLVHKGEIIEGVQLMCAEGLWDSKKREWVDEPMTPIGYGRVSAERVAELTNIKLQRGNHGF